MAISRVRAASRASVEVGARGGARVRVTRIWNISGFGLGPMKDPVAISDPALDLVPHLIKV